MRAFMTSCLRTLSIPAEICRLDNWVLERARGGDQSASLVRILAWTIVIGSGSYGAVFGMWRGPEQALYSALKMPVLMFSVALVSALINSMLAKIVGSGLSTRQTFTSILLGFAVTSILLASLAPVMFFMVRQVPGTGEHGAEQVYGHLLAGHIAVIALCGILGNMRLYNFVRALSGSVGATRRTVVSWILVSGFIGCQLSWLISPFLARPDIPVPFWNPNAFRTNFFEYLWEFSF